METKRFSQFEFIINVLVSSLSTSFKYPCYGSRVSINLFYSFSAGIDFRLQKLTWRLKSVPAMKGLGLNTIVGSPWCSLCCTCTAELFVSIFHSFEAGIANAISSFKWRKIYIFMKNRHVPNWNYLINWASFKRYFFNFFWFSSGRKLVKMTCSSEVNHTLVVY